MTSPNPFSWLRTERTFVTGRNQQPVRPAFIKAGAEAVVDETRLKIFALAQGLQAKQLTLSEFDLQGKRLIKSLHTANAALARGGWSQMRPADYEKVADTVATQYEFWQQRMKDAERGLYGKNFERRSFLAHVYQYADAGRSTYENTRLQVMKEGGAIEARRIRGATDGCPSCVEWAALGWVPIDEMESEYPIGSGECRNNCHCVIVTRREQSEFVSLGG
jgi:hypothetical protein